MPAYRRWRLQQVWGVTEAELDRRELVATTRPAPSPRKTVKNPLREAADEAGPSDRPVKRKRKVGEGRVVLKLPRVTVPPPHDGPATVAAPYRVESSDLKRRLATLEGELAEARKEGSKWKADATASQARLKEAEQRNVQLERRMAAVQADAQAMEHALAQALAQRPLQRYEQLQRRISREFPRFPCRSPVNGSSQAAIEIWSYKKRGSSGRRCASSQPCRNGMRGIIPDSRRRPIGIGRWSGMRPIGYWPLCQSSRLTRATSGRRRTLTRSRTRPVARPFVQK